MITVKALSSLLFVSLLCRNLSFINCLIFPSLLIVSAITDFYGECKGKLNFSGWGSWMLIPFYFFLSLIKVTIPPCDKSDLTACNCQFTQIVQMAERMQKHSCVRGMLRFCRQCPFKWSLKINLQF